MDELIERLERQGADAFHKHYSLGMWQLCAEAAAALRAAAEREKELREALQSIESRINYARGQYHNSMLWESEDGPATADQSLYGWVFFEVRAVLQKHKTPS